MRTTNSPKKTLASMEKRIKTLEKKIKEVSRIADIAFDLGERAFRAWEFSEFERGIRRPTQP